MGENNLINLDDFKSIRLKISVANSTTGTALQDGGRVFGLRKSKKTTTEDLTVRFVEFTDEGYVLEMPRNSCAKGHHLVVKIETQGAKPEIKLETTVKVKGTEKLDDGRDIIRVELSQYEEAQWKAFRGLYSKRQQEVSELFKAIKGY